MTSCNAQPIIPPTPDVRTMALGDAMLALLHSSERWKGASYPDIVQMTATKDMRMAMPSGQSVPLSVNLGTFVVAAGIRMITMMRMVMFKVVPTELNRAIHRVGIEDIIP